MSFNQVWLENVNKTKNLGLSKIRDVPVQYLIDCAVVTSIDTLKKVVDSESYKGKSACLYKFDVDGQTCYCAVGALMDNDDFKKITDADMMESSICHLDCLQYNHTQFLTILQDFYDKVALYFTSNIQDLSSDIIMAYLCNMKAELCWFGVDYDKEEVVKYLVSVFGEFKGDV